jgi:hypothetical protein
MCKFVLYFSAVTLLLVLLFSFFFQLPVQEGLKPVSGSLVATPTPEEYDAALLDLGKTLYESE